MVLTRRGTDTNTSSPRSLTAAAKASFREKRRPFRKPEALYRRGKSRSSGAHLSDSEEDEIENNIEEIDPGIVTLLDE
eukprot:12454843-Alexandrium_andersonii.AAC.1